MHETQAAPVCLFVFLNCICFGNNSCRDLLNYRYLDEHIYNKYLLVFLWLFSFWGGKGEGCSVTHVTHVTLL